MTAEPFVPLHPPTPQKEQCNGLNGEWEVHQYFFCRGTKKDENPPEMQQQQQDVFENFGGTQEHKPVPNVNWHATGMLTPTDIRVQVLDHLKNVKENVTALRAIHSLAHYVSKECLKKILIIYSPIFVR